MSDYTYPPPSPPPPASPPPAHDDCPDAGAPSFALDVSSMLKLDLGNLPEITAPAGDIPQTGDLLHVETAGFELEVGSLFAHSDCPDAQLAEPLISISTGFDGGSAGDDDGGGVGGPFLARLLEPATGVVASAAVLVPDALGSPADGGGTDNCQCDGLLQPLLGNVLDQVDGLLA